MYGVIKDQLRTDLEQLKTEGSLQVRGRADHPAGRGDRGRRRVGAEPLRQQLPRAGRSSGHDHRGPAGPGSVGVRDGLGALHLRHRRDPQGAGGSAGRVPRHRGRDLVRVLLRRQRRPVRDPARPGGRDHLRRAESRQHHRRRAAVQGGPLPLPEPGHGRSGGAAGGGGRGALPDDRHRRRVLDGRLRRPAGPDRRAGRAPTTHWSWSTTRTPSVSSGRPGPARPELFGVRDRVDIVTGTLGKALGGASGGYTAARAGDGGHAAAAFPAVPVLELVGALHRGGGHRHPGSAGSPPATCWRRCGTTRPTSARR